MRISLMVIAVLVSGCGVHHTEVKEPPQGGYQTVHHTVTYDTHPQCVGSCAGGGR